MTDSSFKLAALGHIPVTGEIQTAGIGLRRAESCPMGYGNIRLAERYESFVLAFRAVMINCLVFEWCIKQRTLGVFAALFSFMAMAHASFSKGIDSKNQPLVPALKNNWLIAHVVTCFLGYSEFAVSFGRSALYLVKKRYTVNPNPQGGGALGLLPGASQLEWFNCQIVLFGSLRLRAGIITGAAGADSALSMTGFGCVLYTYFGVNLLLSGLHRYARQ